MLKELRWLYILSLCGLTGCYTGGGCVPRRLPQPQADRVALELLAVQFNASQTNWTVLIIPRTNLWQSK